MAVEGSGDYRRCKSWLCPARLENRWIRRFHWCRQTRHPLAQYDRWGGGCLDHERIYDYRSMVPKRCLARLADSGDTGCERKRCKQHFLVERDYGPTSDLGIERINVCAWSPVRRCSAGLARPAVRPIGVGRPSKSPLHLKQARASPSGALTVNLLRNAKYACDDAKHSDKCITVPAQFDGDGLVRTSVSDN